MRRFPGVLAEIADRLGDAVAEELGREFGGSRLEIPSRETQLRAARDAAIRREFDGRNHRDLARRWGLSTRRIRQILNQQGPKKIEKARRK